MSIFENFEKKLQAEPKSIVFTEGTDARILSAASRLLAGKVLKVILLGNPEAVKEAAAKGSFDITGAEIIDPANYDRFGRDGREDGGTAQGQDDRGGVPRKALSKANYFGTMLVKMGKADCLLGGATYSTADTVRPALQLIKCKPGIQSVSSCFILIPTVKRASPWATAPSTSSPPRTSWWRSHRRDRSQCAEIFGIDPQRGLCCPTPPRAPARARTWTRCATPRQSAKEAASRAGR